MGYGFIFWVYLSEVFSNLWNFKNMNQKSFKLMIIVEREFKR